MESVKNDIVWTGGASQLQIDHLDMENGSGIWVGTNLYDNSNYGYGTINYNIENGTGQASWTGGTHMHFKNTINGLDTEIGGNIGISTQFPGSRLSVGGNEAVGIAYATNAAPTNGLIVQGNVGIGSPSPGSQLDVNGTLNIRLGISSGNVGIGTGLPSPGSSLTIGGKCLGLSGDMYLNASGQVCVCTAGTFPACSSSTCC